MHESLSHVIGGLPKPTKVYFGHEYTVNNLKFALHVEPDNTAVQSKLKRVEALRAKGQFSTPSTLAEEWETNPFMRVDSATIKATVRQADPHNDLTPVSTLAAVRGMKDNF
jgi:hydroxyacylglutathione hydrolase